MLGHVKTSVKRVNAAGGRVHMRRSRSGMTSVK